MPNPLSVDIGKRLRMLRQERGFSIRELARKCGLSANALSTIERGMSSPTVNTLYLITEALGVPTGSLFGMADKKEKVVFTKSDSRARIPFVHGIWEGLGGRIFSGKVEPFVLNLQSGADSGSGMITHHGHEFVYCLAGHLEYQVEDRIFSLRPGDSLLFASRLPHRWRNPGDSDTKIIIVLSEFPDGDTPSRGHFLGPSRGEG
jgi:transcriptional regulator with XRE-family HTH domain